ncbi:uncharacterized protein LOC133788852 isoform X2 [Humulus lupulus]|nr:uncharacterized protein LOC133788852 isoform X2 [Humulus lupulus]XP_062082457.1 uncharacterized protein LOC133788852 isoform X2 [Humulus lupulus]XP_062082458.1 uncharacterized protein LOC133788852 isoform X2 [Humulus lupulus]XP_062082459.1 uncharacterized protein LOC133788852 isoform X2 [Humulus lupulus]
MSKARRQVSVQEEDDAPLLASSLMSHVSPNKLKAIVKHYRAPPEYALHAPQEACRADRPKRGFVALSEQILKAGGIIPLHPFFVAVLNYFDLASLQLSPNSWLTLSCLFIWFKDNEKRAPTAQEVHSLYNLVALPKSKGFYYLQKANSELPLIEGSVSNTGPWKQDFFWVEGPLSVRESFRANPRHFADPSVIGSEAEAIGKLIAADSAEKKATVLFTVENLTRHQLSPVSNSKFLWSITGSKKVVATPAGPSLHEGEAEVEMEDAPPSPGGCPLYGPHDQDMTFPSLDPQAAAGCYAPPGLDGTDVFPQVPHDIGIPDSDYVDLSEPPSNAPGSQFFPFSAPPPASVSGSSVPVQPDIPSVEAEPWVTRMASVYGQRFVPIAASLPVSDWRSLGNVTQPDLREMLRRAAAWVYIVSLRHADSSGVLSASTTERDGLIVQVQELKNELNATKVQLSKARTKYAKLDSRNEKLKAKIKELKGKAKRLERELQGAKVAASGSHEMVIQMGTEVEALRAELQSAQEKVASLEAKRASGRRRELPWRRRGS